MNTNSKPLSHYETIKLAIEYIDKEYKEQPSLDEIAGHVAMSKYHFARVFKSFAGVTPMQFLHATTLFYAKESLKASKSIEESSLDVGLSSSSRLHELFINFEAMTPNAYKTKANSLTITYGKGWTPFGNALIATTSKGICALEFYEEDFEAVVEGVKKHWTKACFVHNDTQAQSLLEKIFVQKERVSVVVKGTNFQVNVWKALLNIPKGEVNTYQDIANFLNRPKAVRAIATAIGSNHIAYLIPCHRVISKTAAMSGYRWGISRKRILLAHESVNK